MIDAIPLKKHKTKATLCSLIQNTVDMYHLFSSAVAVFKNTKVRSSDPNPIVFSRSPFSDQTTYNKHDCSLERRFSVHLTNLKKRLKISKIGPL